ncbi:hypothetical protein [Pseudomonas mosselii]|uniref:hypothetical protein n=1 Tax=Pseudomonas mosselii TaxID=78327 RepID=UPI001F4C0136|nr:hypothetical protein [Pseudomonas mosselii]MCH7417356.1 hypothetical protein [Pseudomonas mosselii]
MVKVLVNFGRLCVAIFYSAGLYAVEPVSPQVNPISYKLSVNLTDKKCEGTIREFGMSTACKLPGGATPNRLDFAFTPGDYISLCGLDQAGFRVFCIVGSSKSDNKDYVHLDNGRFYTVPSGWGLVQYSPYPYDIAGLEYGPGYAWVELYPQPGLEGGRLCVMALGLGSSQSACNGVGRLAKSAKIIGVHNPGKPYWVCFRTPKDEANRCYSSGFGNASAGVLKIMDLDSESPPQYGAIRVKEGRVAGELYSVDYLQ